METVSTYDSPLGRLVLASDGEALTGLWFAGQAHFGSTLAEDAKAEELPVFQKTKEWLDVYFACDKPGFTPKLRLIGTPFRVRVWEALLSIPYGRTQSYAALAKRLNTSARAVGGAISHNPISLIVPCHRVLGANGALCGYAGGLERKQKLLKMEQMQ